MLKPVYYSGIMPHFIPGFSLVGATATGKTVMALQLAEWWLQKKPDLNGVILLSADSRQIYQGLEIISGADIPADFSPVKNPISLRDPAVTQAASHYFIKKLADKRLELWGVAGLTPQLSWSAAQFQQLTQFLLQRAASENLAMIVVGGTGLYQALAFKPDWQIKVPPDEIIRQKAENLSVTELQNWLKTIAPAQHDQLNHSDLHNPRRLIRQLELAQHSAVTENLPTPTTPTLGLIRPIDQLPEKIRARVIERLHLGASTEFAELDFTTAQPMVTTALGVKELKLWQSDQITQEQLIELWTLHELQYAKRQLTWWKKRPQVTWIDVTQPNPLSQAITWLQTTQPTLPDTHL